MSENQNNQVIGPVSAEQLREVLAWDTDRRWGNQVQVFLNPDHAMLILREQITVNVGGPDGDPQIATHNVASWVMPLEVARLLGEILNSMDFEEVKNANPKG
ncbi:MAG: hypothetical protein ACKO1K_02290 [Burkholderiales bacterium]